MSAIASLRVAGSQDMVALGKAPRGLVGRIIQVKPPAAGSLPAAELERRLIELGFVEGASVELLHEGPFGGDPIAVRVDDSTVALRRADAAGVLVEPIVERARAVTLPAMAAE